MTKRKKGNTGLYLLLVVGVAVVGVFVFRSQICAQRVPAFVHNILCGPGSIKPGGGVQQTPAGTRYLAGSEDLPPIT